MCVIALERNVTVRDMCDPATVASSPPCPGYRHSLLSEALVLVGDQARVEGERGEAQVRSYA